MKAKVKIEMTVEVGKSDYKALRAAGPLELVQTAQMQGVKISASVNLDRARQAVNAEKAAPPETEKNV